MLEQNCLIVKVVIAYCRATFGSQVLRQEGTKEIGHAALLLEVERAIMSMWSMLLLHQQLLVKDIDLLIGTLFIASHATFVFFVLYIFCSGQNIPRQNHQLQK